MAGNDQGEDRGGSGDKGKQPAPPSSSASIIATGSDSSSYIGISNSGEYERAVKDPSYFYQTLIALTSQPNLEYEGQAVDWYRVFVCSNYRNLQLKGQPVDLHRVFVEVTDRGGIRKVKNNRKLQEVCAALDLDIGGEQEDLYDMYSELLSCCENHFCNFPDEKHSPNSQTIDDFEDKKGEPSDNQAKLYQLFPPSEDQNVINETIHAIRIGHVCRAALHTVLDIAAKNDSWLGEKVLHSDVILPEILLQPHATAMQADLSIGSAILWLAPPDLVSMMTDIDTWVSRFSHIVYRGKGVQTDELKPLSKTAPDILNIKRVTAEFFIPIPFETTQKLTFTRFSKNIGEDMWAVIDLDLDHLYHKSKVENGCIRRPSGVIVGKFDDFKSKVIWIENMEVLIKSEWAFKASCWINVLNYDSNRMSSKFSELEPKEADVDLSAVFENLARRMRTSFLDCILKSSKEDGWIRSTHKEFEIWSKEKQSGNNSEVVMRFHANGPDKSVFSNLKTRNLEIEWGCTRNVRPPDKKFRLASNDAHEISLHKNKLGDDYLLQQSSTVGFSSFVVSSPILKSDVENKLLYGNWSEVELHPSGFTLMPVKDYYTRTCIWMYTQVDSVGIKSLPNLIQQIHDDISVSEPSSSKPQVRDFILWEIDCPEKEKCKNRKCKFKHLQDT